MAADASSTEPESDAGLEGAVDQLVEAMVSEETSAAQRRAATLRILLRCGPARTSLCGRSSESLSPSPPLGFRAKTPFNPLSLPCDKSDHNY